MDEQALEYVLKTASLAAASLDVFGQEPLPYDHPLWATMNANISPHLSGDTVGWRNALADQFFENLQLFATNRPIPYPVDKIRGCVSSPASQ